METVLLIVTFASTAVALTAAFLVWRLRSREQTRQQARIAALSREIRGAPLTLEVPVLPVEEADVAADDRPVFVQAPVDDAPGVLFARALGPRPGRTRGPALAFGAVAAAAVLTVVLVSGSHDANAQKPVGLPTPLELLALEQQEGKGEMTFSGLVRNPAAAGPVRDLTAVVLLFDRAGGFVASSRAKVDYTTLKPGEESPFTVSLRDAPASAARYRLSFRQDDSGIVPHVDRREKS